VPLWGAANTDMAKKVEKVVKELVQKGAIGKYTITPGPAVGMTAGRAALQGKCDAEQWKLVEAEQWLPDKLVIQSDVFNHETQAWVAVLHETINNYVPETVPYLRKA
jgi:hypothetical protein